MALMKLCRCGKKIEYHIKYCDNCTAEIENEKKEKVKKYDKDIRNSTENIKYTSFYNSKAWKTLSDIIKRNYNGICVMCLIDRGEVTPSNTTHHIEELKENWNLRLVEENLIPLCHSCHNDLHIDYKEKDKKHLKNIIFKYKDKY